MAGQSPEPSFQPTGQDQALTQGRPAWQAPTYTPPGGAGGQRGYAAPSYGAQDQAYAQQDQAYPQQDQAYPTLGQGAATGQGQDYQAYPGYQAPGYGAQPGPGQAAGTPQWQAGNAQAPGRPKQPGDKGFLGSLFDFSFTSLVTPKIIRILYILFTVWTVLVGVILLVVGFETGGMAGGLFTLIIVEPIFVLLTLGIYRVVLEAFMVLFRIYEETKKIRENSESVS